mmetsp:Transcript_66782/g.193353  ORF Transcript_66782/g.193353 Transcript_66782/m.193353 type:complete len:136 (+) Transcript_66782:123-530(+)
MAPKKKQEKKSRSGGRYKPGQRSAQGRLRLETVAQHAFEKGFTSLERAVLERLPENMHHFRVEAKDCFPHVDGAAPSIEQLAELAQSEVPGADPHRCGQPLGCPRPSDRRLVVQKGQEISTPHMPMRLGSQRLGQ